MAGSVKPKTCSWCGATLGWRSRLRLELVRCRMCATCHRYGCMEAGIYLQNGGPPYGRMSREGTRE